MLVVHMIGNAHIDPVWLWPWQAGVDEALATFRSAADRCDEYPEFIFTRGEAWLYDQVEQIDPELFTRVRKHVESGQWHITGGQWIQPDVNLPTWAGLRRQIIHGHRYFKDRFGITPRIGYNVDSFGHPATLPDLLQQEGYLGYVFARPSQKQVPLPQSTFRWKGACGGEVLGYRIPKPYVTRTHDLYGQIMLAADNADPNLGHIMCFYGVGNHGGGPTKQNIEYILEHQNAFDGLELRFSTPDAFFEAADQKRNLLPEVDVELQHTFPGCYVVMGDIKREQHRGEHRLEHTASAVETYAEPAEKTALHAKLDAAWDDLLFTAFHDILAGTSIPAAWPAVRGFQGRARVVAEEVMTLVTRRWVRRHLPPINHQQIALLNPGGDAFDGLIEHEPFLDFDTWNDRWLADGDGNPLDIQFTQPQSTSMLTPAVLFESKVPPDGATVLRIRDDAPPARADVKSDLKASSSLLANDHLSVDLGRGGIRQMTLDGTPLLGSDGISLHLRQDTADTWGFQIDSFVEPIVELADALDWKVEESGPLRARVSAQGRLGCSPFRWTLSLRRGDPRLHMTLEMTFCEQYRLLQMPIRLANAPSHWRASLAGGAIDRDASPAEWPMHGWGRCQATPGDPGTGLHLAVVTPDAFSASLDNDRFTWSLLRSPRMAWGGQDASEYVGRDYFTDQGQHTLEFTLVPGESATVADEALYALARRIVRPPIVIDRYEGLDRPPWGDSPPRRMWTGAEQRARQDGRMAHLRDEGGAGFEEALRETPE